MPKLTKRVIDAVRPPASGETFLWDTELRGFGLRVKSTGVMSFLVQYRVGKRTRRYVLGRVGAVTPDKARALARSALEKIAQGGDPSKERKDARNAKTMDDLCDQYLSDHVEVHNRPATQKSARRLTDAVIRPALRTLYAKDVTGQDVAKLHLSLRSTPRQANHALSILSKMMSLAELWGYRPPGSNPCKGVRRYPEKARERFLSGDELRALGSALQGLERESAILPDAANAIRLLALTGCRQGEILALEWEHIDFESGEMLLPEAKAGARRHTIGAEALALLAAIPRKAPSPYVLHGRDGEALSVHALEYAWRAVRARAGLAGVRLHDLRHTVGTYAGQTGANAYLVRDKLGHKTLAMTGRYVNRDISPVRDLSDKVEARIAAAMSAGSGEVVALKRPAACGKNPD